LIDEVAPEGTYADHWDGERLTDGAMRYFGLSVPAAEWIKEDGMNPDLMAERLTHMADSKMAEKTVRIGTETMRMAEKSLLLQVLDQQWKDHLLALDHMKQAVGLRSYAQKDPLNEYKREAFILFDRMLDQLRQTTTSVMAHFEIKAPEPEQPARAEEQAEPTPPPRPTAIDSKTPRNAPCPCGSGKKFKHCHGAF